MSVIAADKLIEECYARGGIGYPLVSLVLRAAINNLRIGSVRVGVVQAGCIQVLQADVAHRLQTVGRAIGGGIGVYIYHFPTQSVMERLNRWDIGVKLIGRVCIISAPIIHFYKRNSGIP